MAERDLQEPKQPIKYYQMSRITITSITIIVRTILIRMKI